MTYQTVAAGWHDFFIVAGTAAATLVGLLFVGLSLHLRTVIASPDVRGLARITLANFALVLIYSLFMVIPQPATAAAAQVIGCGAISLLATAPSLLRVRQIGGKFLQMGRRERVRIVLRFGLSVASYLALIVAGILLLSSLDLAFSVLLSVTLVLLVISLRNTWDLLVTVADVTLPAKT